MTTMQTRYILGIDAVLVELQKSNDKKIREHAKNAEEYLVELVKALREQ